MTYEINNVMYGRKILTFGNKYCIAMFGTDVQIKLKIQLLPTRYLHLEAFRTNKILGRLTFELSGL